MHAEIQTLLSALDRERKRSRIVLTICSVYTLATTIGIAAVYSQREIAMAEVWPVLAAQVLAIVVLASLLRSQFLRPRPAPVAVREAAESALGAIHARMQTTKLVAVSMAAILALSAVAISGLLESGKMDAKAVSSMGSVLVLIAVCNASILWLRWKRRLRPQRDRLHAILRDLDSA